MLAWGKYGFLWRKNTTSWWCQLPPSFWSRVSCKGQIGKVPWKFPGQFPLFAALNLLVRRPMASNNTETQMIVQRRFFRQTGSIFSSFKAYFLIFFLPIVQFWSSLNGHTASNAHVDSTKIPFIFISQILRFLHRYSCFLYTLVYIRWLSWRQLTSAFTFLPSTTYGQNHAYTLYHFQDMSVLKVWKL